VEAIEVVEDPAVAVVALDPLRSRLLALLGREPSSAAGLAPVVGLTRQKVRYHLQALADRGLITEVGQHRHGGLTERVFAASAGAYVVSPAAMGAAAPDPDRVTDRLSASYLVAVAARAVREVADLVRRAAAVDRRLPTLTIDTEVRFRSAAERAEFTAELRGHVLDLVARYHDDTAPGGRRHRLIVLAHPSPPEDPS
jgi:DNA-binding transcriptional ArsR family regulator